MFESLILAQESTNGSNALVTLLIYGAILGGIFYLLILRPQRGRARRHQELMGSLEIGDEVQTAGGIYGIIRRMDEDSMVIEVEDGGSLRVARRAIASKVTQPD